jgi:hypothetical protein
MRDRSAAGSLRADPPPCGNDESREVLVVGAVVGGVRPTTYWFRYVVVPADEASSVHVEGLSWGASVDVWREADLEAPPLLTCLQPGITPRRS